MPRPRARPHYLIRVLVVNFNLTMTNSLKLSHLMSPVKDRPSLNGQDPGDFLSENSRLKLKVPPQCILRIL